MLLAAENVSKRHATCRKFHIGRWAFTRGSELLGQFIDDHLDFWEVVVFGDVLGILAHVLEGLNDLLVLK